jgi:hypothetical protein
VREVPADEVAQRQAEFATFERGFVYPLGADRFHVDHGGDYLAFFRQLGRAHAFVAEVDGRIEGVLVLVQRSLAGRDVGYLCDWKVARGPRSTGMARRLLQTATAVHLPPTAPVFGVSMNTPGGENRLVRAALRCTGAGPLRTTPLLLFACDTDAWVRAAPQLTAAFGPVGLHTTSGHKDIVLASTGRPMPLLHIWHGAPMPDEVRPPRADAVYMFCLPAGDPLLPRLRRLGLRASATATIVHRHLDDVDWRCLRSGDI